MIKDARGRTPRFVVFESYVKNQFSGECIAYTKDWMPAYKQLLVQYRKNEI
jgi:hypothetical protein